MKSIIVAGIVLLSSASSSQSFPEYSSGQSLESIYERAETIVYGRVDSIQPGDCGEAGHTGFAMMHVKKVIRGGMSEGGSIQVCSPSWLMIARNYIVVGTTDGDGRLIPEVDGFVMSGGRCGRFYRVDYMMANEVEGKNGDVFFAVGRLIPRFAERFGPVLGIRVEELVPPPSKYLCGD